MNVVAEELAALSALATRINRLPGPNSHAPGNWYHERDEIARALARGIGRIRKELGLKESGVTSFCAALVDSGVTTVRSGRAFTPVNGLMKRGVSNRPIPVVRRGQVPSRRELEAARTVL